MDSSVDHGHFWGCIGDSRGWTGGMVGPNRSVNQTEFFACRETTRSPIATPTAAPTPRPIVNTVGDCGGHHVDCGGDLGAPYQDTGITCPAAAGNRTAGANVTVRSTVGAQRCLGPVPSSSWVLFVNKIQQIGRMHVVSPVRDLAGMMPGIGG